MNYINQKVSLRNGFRDGPVQEEGYKWSILFVCLGSHVDTGSEQCLFSGITVWHALIYLQVALLRSSFGFILNWAPNSSPEQDSFVWKGRSNLWVLFYFGTFGNIIVFAHQQVSKKSEKWEGTLVICSHISVCPYISMISIQIKEKRPVQKYIQIINTHIWLLTTTTRPN